LSPGLLLGLTVLYLGGLYLLASVVDRSERSRAWARHPYTSALSLGVYATSWSFFGSVGFGASEGYRFLGIHIGATISCALVPVFWEPLARLCRERQLASLADLLAFRYQSRAVGAVVAVLFLVGSLPYQALQLHATVELVTQLAGAPVRSAVALAITALLIGFAVTYGVRHVTPLERHDGFVAAVAVESMVKLVALVAVAAFAVFGVWHGWAGLTAWLTAHPEAPRALVRPAREHSWTALLVLSGAAIFLLPRQWHMGMTEGGSRGLRAASWLLPLYLLVINLTVPLVLWGGQALHLPGSEAFYVLGLCRASGSTALTALVFLGALSAGCAMIVVTTVACASMLQNQLVLPFMGLPRGDLYVRLRWLRRALTASIILAGHAVYLLLAHDARIVDLGLASFVAVAQALPGVLGVMFWPSVTARGVVLGLCAGSAAWLGSTVVPLLAAAGTLPAAFDWLRSLELADDPWTFITAFTLGANVVALVLGSALRPATAAERNAAAVCSRSVELDDEATLDVTSPEEFAIRLAPVLGERAASAEVRSALAQLGLTDAEHRPEALRALRNRVETNLSGLLGPVTARMIVDEHLGLSDPLRRLLSAQLRYAEERFATITLSGPTLALDQARQFLRDLLDELPVGVCALGPAGDVALWNRAMQRATQLAADDVIGASLARLPEPWASTLTQFATSATHNGELRVAAATFALHRAEVSSPAALGGCVIVLEDRTRERELSAQIAHQDRLASIGRFAAGVAHEIGNPLTGITSLAQNLKVDSDDDDVRERLDLLVAQAGRIDRIVRGLVSFARAGDVRSTATRTRVSVTDVVHDAVTLARLGRPGRGVQVETALASNLTLPGDRQGLEQVLVNLLTNACDASTQGSVVRVAVERAARSVRFIVTDQGCGMDDAVRARAFEPFFTTKPAGEGTGIGLSLVYGIVAEHGGSIAIDSSPGQGTRVTMELPA
jgi:signal transduction histidine kinase/Na+/proline symporter